jgi:hypothetical protein
MSHAFRTVKSVSAMKLGAFDGSVGRAIRQEGFAARRIAAPSGATACREDCR